MEFGTLFQRANRQRGSAALGGLSIIVLCLLGGFLILKFGGALMDITGMESDLKSVADDLAIECVADLGCEDTLKDQILEVQSAHAREMEFKWDTMDYNAGSNVFKVEGYKIIDLKVHKLTWNFTLVVDIYK